MEAARPAGAGDLPALARLAADAVAEQVPQRGGAMWARTIGRRPPYEEGLAAAIDDPDALVLVGTIDGTPIGYAVARLDVMADGAGLVVVDEAYQPFAQASFMPRLAEFDNLIVMRTVSKLGLAGIRLGYMSAGAALLSEFDKVRPPYNVNVLTEATA